MTDRITEDVLAAARRGNGDAFAVIWGELSPAVAGYLSARGVHDAEGVTSDVFVTLLPRLRELTGGVAGLRTFVFSVFAFTVASSFRRLLGSRASTPDQSGPQVSLVPPALTRRDPAHGAQDRPAGWCRSSTRSGCESKRLMRDCACPSA